MKTKAKAKTEKGEHLPAQGNIETLSIQVNNYRIRREMHQGRWHIVVPVVMLKDGVHTANRGALLHLAEEYGRDARAWDDIPVVVQHPTDNDGVYISAKSPEVIDSQAVGRIFHTACNGALKAEAWIDEEKIKQVSPTALSYIQQQRPLDVSTGVVSDEDYTPGNWNGEDYIAIARNHRPDHLALLPGGTGACSWNDGCGIRANEQKGDKNVDLKKTMKDLSKQGFSVVQINESGAREIGSKIQAKLDAMDTDLKFHYLEDFFPNTNDFVYKVNIEGSSKLFRRDYQVNADESLEFTEEPVGVIKRTNFEPIQTNTAKGGMKNMAKDKGKEGCCPEQVKLIIQSEHTRFEESDRPWLEGLEKESLIKLLPIDLPKSKPADPPQINETQAIEVLKEQLGTPEKFMELLSGEMKDQMQHGWTLYQAERAKLVEHITANSEFSAEDLKGESIERLNKLASLAKPDVDFSLNNAGNEHHDSSQPANIVLPMNVQANETEKK